MWPDDADALVAVQRELAKAAPAPWRPSPEGFRYGGCWVCFPRGLAGPGRAADPAWVAAAVMSGHRVLDQRVLVGEAGAAYRPGLLALRLGPLMEQVLRALATWPDVLLLDATGRDHPRGAGLAMHLGAALDLPTIGVTHRPLVAEGDWPADRRGGTSPLRIGNTIVGCWMRTRQGTRPLVVHPGWRVDLATAIDVVAATTGRYRTPEPLRTARRLTRSARDADERSPGP
jgi:deoxyribonuclease V